MLGLVIIFMIVTIVVVSILLYQNEQRLQEIDKKLKINQEKLDKLKQSSRSLIYRKGCA
jgi:cell division protein FtsL